MASSFSSFSSPVVQPAILWPSKYTPGTTDNFVSNEVIVKDLKASHIWALLADITKWETYYGNVSQITPPRSGPMLEKGDVFRFSTFGFPVLPCHVLESVPPSAKHDGRLAWEAILEGGPDEGVEVYHAWLVHNLPDNRVRILTQESQIGKPAADFASKRPNIMLLGHQDWLDGLVAAARGQKLESTNLGSVKSSRD